MPKTKWNLLFLLCDEFRFPPEYNQTPEIRAWEKENLKAVAEMRRTGVEFLQHYASGMACAPSRTTLFTGQYYSLHGVSQTDGAAKAASDPSMFWLDPNTVPTLGNYLQECGYRTFYKGKWHISNSDIVLPGTQDPLLSYNRLGYQIPRITNLYIQSNRLEKYGFNQYVGPVPHGTNPRDSGGSAAIGLSGRDIVYSSEVIQLIEELSSSSNRGSDKEKPWCVVASLVNPHDQALFGEITKRLPMFNFEIDPTVPYIPPAPTANEDLQSKPRCQADYQKKYQLAFQPTKDSLNYRQIYYTLQKKMDRHMHEILTALRQSKFYENTVVVYTSDHGDFLGAHGLFQKWYSAYQESIHIPLYIRLPVRLCQKKLSIDSLTTHVDLLPTLLSLVGNSTSEIQTALLNLKKTHLDARHLVGRNLSRLVWAATLGKKGSITRWKEKPILFLNGDLVLTGPQNISWDGKRYPPVVQPSTIQTIILRWQDTLYKFSKYYDPTDENTPPEYELYNLTSDPNERKNLLGKPYATKSSVRWGWFLRNRLERLYQRKALVPRERPRPIDFLPRPS
jgi:arylsulfatase A-like enzyme